MKACCEHLRPWLREARDFSEEVEEPIGVEVTQVREVGGEAQGEARRGEEAEIV